MESFLNIPYTPSVLRDPSREFDLYEQQPVAPQLNLRPLLCFVHGGAWRSEDKRDHNALAHKLALATHLPIVIPNYRLTSPISPAGNQFRHPGHAEDILQFMTFLMTWEGPDSLGRVYDPQRIYLMGHSCSAHMLSSIFLDSSSISPSLSPPVTLLQTVKAIVMSEGIYDLDSLLSRFPTYRELFIEPAFGRRDSYADFSTTQFSMRIPGIRWMIIHSTGDTLVDMSQSEAMYRHLRTLNGIHADARVLCNVNEINVEHNDVLLQDEFTSIVGHFLLNHDE